MGLRIASAGFIIMAMFGIIRMAIMGLNIGPVATPPPEPPGPPAGLPTLIDLLRVRDEGQRGTTRDGDHTPSSKHETVHAGDGSLR